MAYHGTNSSKSLLIGSFLRAIKIQKLRSSSIRAKEHVNVRI